MRTDLHRFALVPERSRGFTLIHSRFGACGTNISFDGELMAGGASAAPEDPMPSNETIKVLVLYQDPLVCSGLTATLREQPDFELVGASASACDAASWPEGGRADVVVADYEHGLAILARSRMQTPPRCSASANVLIVTQRDSEREIRHALEHGDIPMSWHRARHEAERPARHRSLDPVS